MAATCPPTPVAEAPAPDRRTEAAASLALAGIAFVIVTGETLPVGLIGQVAAGVGATESQIGLSVSVYALVAALSGLPLTRLSAGVDRRTVLVACAVLFGVTTALASAATELWVFYLARGVAALSHGTYFAVAAPALIRLARPGARARAGSRVMVGASAALVLGTPLATLLGQAAGWRTAMLAVAGVSTAFALAVATVVPPLPPLAARRPVQVPGPAPDPASDSRVLTTLRSRALAVVFVVTALLVTSHFAMWTFIEPYADERLGVVGGSFTLLLLAYGCAAVTGSALGGRIADAAPVAGVRVAAACFVALHAGLWWSGHVEAPVVGRVLLVLWGGTFSLLAVSSALAVLRRVPSYRAETASASHGIVFQLGIVAGSAVGSLLYGRGLLADLPLVPAVLGLAVLGLLLYGGRAFRRGSFD